MDVGRKTRKLEVHDKVSGLVWAATEGHPYMHETTARDARMKRSLYSRLLVTSNTG